MDGNSGRTNGDLVGDETKMVITRCRYVVGQPHLNKV